MNQLKKRSYGNVNAPFKKPRQSTLTASSGSWLKSLPKPAAARGELKDITTTTTNTIGLPATSTVTLINGVGTGVTPNNRIGRRITMKSLLVRGTFAMAATGTGNSPLRVVIVYDRQTNKAAPAATDVFTADAIYAAQLLDNSRRFQVLMDEEVEAFGAAGPAAHQFVRYIKMNLPVEFDNTGVSTVAGITTGSVYMFAWSSGNLTVAAPFSTILTRIRFSDD